MTQDAKDAISQLGLGMVAQPRFTWWARRMRGKIAGLEAERKSIAEMIERAKPVNLSWPERIFKLDREIAELRERLTLAGFPPP